MSFSNPSFLVQNCFVLFALSLLNYSSHSIIYSLTAFFPILIRVTIAYVGSYLQPLKPIAPLDPDPHQILLATSPSRDNALEHRICRSILLTDACVHLFSSDLSSTIPCLLISRRSIKHIRLNIEVGLSRREKLLVLLHGTLISRLLLIVLLAYPALNDSHSSISSATFERYGSTSCCQQTLKLLKAALPRSMPPSMPSSPPSNVLSTASRNGNFNALAVDIVVYQHISSIKSQSFQLATLSFPLRG
jgi:hypothetical protein